MPASIPKFALNISCSAIFFSHTHDSDQDPFIWPGWLSKRFNLTFESNPTNFRVLSAPQKSLIDIFLSNSRISVGHDVSTKKAFACTLNGIMSACRMMASLLIHELPETITRPDSRIEELLLRLFLWSMKKIAIRIAFFKSRDFREKES